MDIRLNIFDAVGAGLGIAFWLDGQLVLGMTLALGGIAVSEVYEYFKGEKR